MAAYRYKIKVSITDANGITTYPGSPAFVLSLTDKVSYHLSTYVDGTLVTDAAIIQVSGTSLKVSSPKNVTIVSWQSSGGTAAFNLRTDVTATGTCLLTPTFTTTGTTFSVKIYDSILGWQTATLDSTSPIIPNVSFSVVTSSPTIPTGSALLSDLALQKNASGMTGPYRIGYAYRAVVQALPAPQSTIFQNSVCPGSTADYWISPLTIPIVTSPVTSPSFSNPNVVSFYRYEIRFYNADGSPGAPTVSFTPKSAKDAPAQLQAFNTYIHNIKIGLFCPKVNSSLPSTSTASGHTSSGTPPAAAPNPYANTPVNYNPPNNINTRNDPYGIQSRPQRAYVGSQLETVGLSSSAALGYIYQDDSTAQAVNGAGSTAGALNKWGFRFTYNPTNISYGTQSSSALDVTTFAKDPANLVGGNTVVQLELYLNRIVDFQDLTDPNLDIQKSYPFKEHASSMSAEDINGILTRGTEYDLEFLYRVVNGDPRTNDVLSDSTLASSDFGYITGVPFKLILHNDLRYFCSIQSITVNHVMFTPSMVPILSVVSLSLIRYPGLTTAESDIFNNITAANKQAISNANKPPTLPTN